jgi:hypothetical protein
MTVPGAGWQSIRDGELLRLAEKSFDVFVTVDKAMEREYNLASYKLGFVILRVRSNRMVDFQPIITLVMDAIGSVRQGCVVHVGAAKSESL